MRLLKASALPWMTSLHRLVRRAADREDDRVRVAVRLRRLRPLVEVRVAHEPERVLRPVARDQYGPVAGSGCVPLSRSGVPAGTTVGERKRELVQEVRVGCDEMEGDGLRGVVGDDPVARGRSALGVLAAGRADDAVVVAAGSLPSFEVALEGGADVGRP